MLRCVLRSSLYAPKRLWSCSRGCWELRRGQSRPLRNRCVGVSDCIRVEWITVAGRNSIVFWTITAIHIPVTDSVCIHSPTLSSQTLLFSIRRSWRTPQLWTRRNLEWVHSLAQPPLYQIIRANVDNVEHQWAYNAIWLWERHSDASMFNYLVDKEGCGVLLALVLTSEVNCSGGTKVCTWKLRDIVKQYSKLTDKYEKEEKNVQYFQFSASKRTVLATFLFKCYLKWNSFATWDTTSSIETSQVGHLLTVLQHSSTDNRTVKTVKTISQRRTYYIYSSNFNSVKRAVTSSSNPGPKALYGLRFCGFSLGIKVQKHACLSWLENLICVCEIVNSLSMCWDSLQ